MPEDLISKKELLELTDISYGQLYRWKRKGLIPEDWFIRKSTYTGQETFFPRSKVLSRIDKIKNMKEDVSLDDLADVFSPSPDNVVFSSADLLQRGIVTADVLPILIADRGEAENFDFNDTLLAFTFNKLLVSGDVSLDEGRLVLDLMRTSMIRLGNDPFEIILTRKLGVFGCFAVCPPGQVFFDRDMRLVNKLNIGALTEELKLKLI